MIRSHQRTLLCYGDSNTHGTIPMTRAEEVGRHPPDRRWPGVLGARLGDGWRVVEEGLPGRTTVHDDPVEGWSPGGVDRNGLAFLPAALVSHRPIEQIVLMLGTNDLKARFSVGAHDIALSLAKLLDVIRSSGVTAAGMAPAVLVIAPPPILETGPGRLLFASGAAKSHALAAQIEPVAAQYGAGFLDAGRVIRSSDVDGIHFDADSHGMLGRAVGEALARTLPFASG